LERVFAVVQGTEHPVAVRAESCTMGLDETAEGILVASGNRFEQLPLGDV
jgi:hypothetical protein